MLHVVLYQPEIPPNTGNIIRLSVNAGARLHLIQPLGFDLDCTKLRRAGLDYREWADVVSHASWQAFLDAIQPTRIVAFSTRGRRLHSAIEYRSSDVLLFGPETRGLPEALLRALPPDLIVRIPMVAGSRSLNLSNAVAIALYEAWRQLAFVGQRD